MWGLTRARRDGAGHLPQHARSPSTRSCLSPATAGSPCCRVPRVQGAGGCRLVLEEARRCPGYTSSQLPGSQRVPETSSCRRPKATQRPAGNPRTASGRNQAAISTSGPQGQSGLWRGVQQGRGRERGVAQGL